MLRSALPDPLARDLPERVTAAVPEPSDEIDEEHPHSRRARLDARRRRIRWAGVLAVALIVGAAGPSPRSRSPTTRPPARPRPVLTGATSVGQRLDVDHRHAAAEALNVRPLSPRRSAAPVGRRRLACRARSGPRSATLAGDTGVVETYVDYKVSSGLWRRRTRNWQAYAAAADRAAGPRSGRVHDRHQRPPTSSTRSTRTTTASPTGRSTTAQRVAQHDGPLRRRREAPHRVLARRADDARPQTWTRACVEVNRVMQEEAAKRGPHVVYVDAYRCSATRTASTPTGSTCPSTREPGETKIARARIGDGVHLTPAGAEYLATPVFALLDSRYRLDRAGRRRAPDQLHVA